MAGTIATGNTPAPAAAAAPAAVTPAAAAPAAAAPVAAAPAAAAPVAAAAPAAPVAGAEVTPPAAAAAAAAPSAAGAQDDKGGTADSGAAASKAPDKYDLRLPAGSPHMPEAAMKAFESRMREAGVTNDEAQALLEQSVQQVAELHQAQSVEWAAQTLADPVLGGANIDATTQRCNIALEKLAPPATPYGVQLRELLNEGGYGNHPAIVAFLANAGKLLEEAAPKLGTPAPGGGAPRKSAAEVLFPGTPKP